MDIDKLLPGILRKRDWIKLIICFAAGIFMICSEMYSQVAFWQQYFGGSGFDVGEIVIVKPDGAIVVSGQVSSVDGIGKENHSVEADIALIKYATQGVIFWKRTFGGSGEERLESLIETSDGGYAFIGTTNSTDGDIEQPKGELDIWVVKLDDLGRKQWAKTFGGSGNDRGYSIVETYDGGFFIAGESGSVNGNMRSPHHGGLDSWLAKLSPDGKLLWEKHYGGTDNERITHILSLSKDVYVLIHASNSKDGDRKEQLGKKDVWITQINSLGDIQWSMSVGGEDNDEIHDCLLDNEGNIVAVGTTFSSTQDVNKHKGLGDAWICKLTLEGELSWSWTYGGEKADGANSIIQTQDGGYLMAGVTRSRAGDIQFSYGYYDAWVLKTDRNGAMIWSRNFGFEGKDLFSDVKEVSTGGFIAIGCSELVEEGTPLPGHQGELDFWVCNFSDPRREGVKPFVTPPMLKGKVLDKESKRPLQSIIQLTQNETLEVLSNAESNLSNGEFALLLPPYGLMSINVVTEGYMFYGENIRADSLNFRSKVQRNIELEPISLGASLVLRNIYFDTGRWDLLPDSYAELERLIYFLDINARVVIEVSGHTDNTGDKEDKIELSLNRANAVKNYLIDRGIASDRLVVKGYGMYKPIASNETYMGRQRNRRVEFMIISM